MSCDAIFICFIETRLDNSIDDRNASRNLKTEESWTRDF